MPDTTSIVFVLYRSYGAYDWSWDCLLQRFCTYGAEVLNCRATGKSASEYAIKQKQIARPANCGTKQSALPKRRLQVFMC